MGAKEMLEKVGEVFGSAATVKNVFGDPIQFEGKTVVPVAKVVMGIRVGIRKRPCTAPIVGECSGRRWRWWRRNACRSRRRS